MSSYAIGLRPAPPSYVIKGYIRQASFGLIIERFAPKQPKSCVPELSRILISTYVLVWGARNSPYENVLIVLPA